MCLLNIFGKWFEPSKNLHRFYIRSHKSNQANRKIDILKSERYMWNPLGLLKRFRLPLVLLLLVIGRMVIFGDDRIPVIKIFNDLILPDRNTPRLKIESPASQSSFREGQEILFKGHNPVQCDQIRWLSSIDGQFQKGRYSFRYGKLSVGSHIIILSTYCGGRQTNTRITISIQPIDH